MSDRPRLPADRGHFRSLDALRAVAALLVVLFHTQSICGKRFGIEVFGGTFAVGYRGVDLFFVLSGFVITYAHVADWGQPGHLTSYAMARAARLYPAVFVMTLLALAVYKTGYHFPGVESSGKSTPWSIAASFLLLPQAAEPLVNVTWTLKFEVFFYTVFGLLILDRRWMAGLVLWQVTIVIMALGGIQFDQPWARICFNPLCCEFGFGMLGAMLVRHIRAGGPPRLLQAEALPLIGLSAGAALFGTAFLTQAFATMGGQSLSGVAVYGGGAWLIVTGCALLESSDRLGAPTLLLRLGRSSYAIYLVHFSAINLLTVLISHQGVLPRNDETCLVIALLAVSAGVAFDQLFDRRCQRLLRSLRKSLAVEPPVVRNSADALT